MNLPVQNPRVHRKAPLPESVTDHGNWMAAGHKIVFGRDDPPDDRVHAQNAKIIPGNDLSSTRWLDSSGKAETQPYGRIRQNSGEELRAITQMPVLVVGEGSVPPLEDDELLRFPDR